MRALTRKLLRDVVNMRGAVITISVVVAAGIAAFVTLRGTYLSISDTRARYYGQQRFADVFSELERAPLSLVGKLEQLPGVARVYPRVMGTARVPLERLPVAASAASGEASTAPSGHSSDASGAPSARAERASAASSAPVVEPAEARVLSIPENGVPPLNGIQLLAGRMPRNDRDDEALLIELFAEKRGIQPGAVLPVVIEGRQRNLRIVGLAMSPEFVLAVPNGASAPAPERFAVLWMRRSAVEAAYDMRGAFNSVALGLTPRGDPAAVVRELDRLLDRYGGLGAYARERQTSHYFLSQDLLKLATLATIAPMIFLGVAAFLLNVVLSRLIELDRPQIATLKALGYSDREVGLHYFELSLIVIAIGALLGLAVGAWLGAQMTGLYVKFYRMPRLVFHMDASLASSALLVSFGAGLLGSAISVRRVILLPPAEAMRPAAPTSYKQGWIGRFITQRLSSASRMVAREITRRPMRTVLSALGVGAATGIIVVGQHFTDAMDYLVDFYLQAQQRETLAVNFVNPISADSVRALGALPGVRDVQWHSTLRVRVRAGHRERVVPLVSHPHRHALRPLLDDLGREVAIEPGSVLFTDVLAKVLQVAPGDTVMVEPLQGERTPRALTLTGTLPELMALWIHISEQDFVRWLGSAPMATGAVLQVDADRVELALKELLDMPQVASTTRKQRIIDDFREQQGKTMGTFSAVLTLFAVTIAISVVYNNARVALSLRGRELASLRVLGFTRAEISTVLISELAVQVLLGIPLGLWFGHQLVELMLSSNDPESFRFPALVSRHSYAVAALVTALAALASALLVRRKLDRLDLVAVLKTRE